MKFILLPVEKFLVLCKTDFFSPSRTNHSSKVLLFAIITFILLQRKEREMQQKLEEQDESAVEIKENFSSLQQEVDVKTKKLKKV